MAFGLGRVAGCFSFAGGAEGEMLRMLGGEGEGRGSQ